MNKSEALNILGVSASYTPESLKAAYRKLISQYHPDRNPLGLHMTQLLNEAYELMKDESGEAQEKAEGFCESILNALRSVADLGLNVELCGTWVWVSGDTKPHKEVLKAAGYKWSSKKLMWYYHSGERKSWGRGKYTIDEIRERHGSRGVNVKGWERVRAG
jgi:hypothetical protein